MKPLLVVSLALASACASVADSWVQGLAKSAAANADAVYVERVDQARSAALAAPGDAGLAISFAAEVEGAIIAGSMARGALSPALVDDACGALDQVTGDRPRALAAKGELLRRAGREDEGIAALEASQAAGANPWAGPALADVYARRGEGERAVDVCKESRAAARHDDEAVYVLDECARAVGDTWMAEEDRALRAARTAPPPPPAEEPAPATAWDAAREREKAALAKATASAASAPSTVSVTLRCTCDKTVPIFFGQKPKFGSGTRSTCSSHSVSSKTMRPGDMIWLIDDHENGLGAATISASTRTVEIGCSGVVSR